MNGVMMPSVSAGSSQREASVMCTPQVMVPSGGAVAGRAGPIRKAIVRSPPTTRETECLMVPPSRGGEYTPAAALLCEPPKDAGVARVGLDHDLLQRAGTSAIAYRRQDDHLAVRRSRQPLTDPAVRPCTMYFWKTRTRSTAGSAPRKPEAAITE